jgi:hypothetical protein
MIVKRINLMRVNLAGLAKTERKCLILRVWPKLRRHCVGVQHDVRPCPTGS